MPIHPRLAPRAAALFVTVVAAGCGGGSSTGAAGLPQLAAAQPGTLQGSCADLATKIAFANTSITSATAVAAGTVAGVPAPDHCLVTGKMYERVSAVDGKTYAIGFEMRLPLNWNGRFFYQANGGTDGNVVTATGPAGIGLPNSALTQGFAVISSDAGHAGGPLGSAPAWGVDPQARLDYGYQAVGKLTPMAKKAIEVAYGRGPDRSYIGGCSNGGRHTMVAAARYADQYDGFLVGDPGFRLPLAATANIKGAQLYAPLATNPQDLSTAFTTAERAVVSNAVLKKCDALDGSADGLVQDTKACQAAFNLDRDVPTCTASRDGTCLTAEQKAAVGRQFAGTTTSTGAKIYSSFPFDNGLATNGWSFWKFTVPMILDSGAVGLIWQAPPEDPATFVGPQFALTGNVDTMLAKVNATTSVYTESAMSFMTPPNATDMSKVKARGAKMMVYHGTADPIFSSDDTTAWYEGVTAVNAGDATNFARFYRVPGMNHCSGGPATDQFDMLTPLVKWVEQGTAPNAVTAAARGAGSAVVNADVPPSWAPNRTRPLCVYPRVARYNGSGSIEDAASFSCVAPAS